MGAAVFIFFVFVWFFPVVLKQRKNGFASVKSILLTILTGLVPATLVLLALEVIFGWICRWTGIVNREILYGVLKALIMYALIEEGVKFFFADIAVKKQKDATKIDYIVLFGAIGLGYEIVESLMLGIGNVAAAVIRGAFVAHIMYQFIMGAHFFEYKKAKSTGNEQRAKKELLLALLLPFLLHGVNDLTVEVFKFVTGVSPAVFNIILIALNTFGLVLGLVYAYSAVKDGYVLSAETAAQEKTD